MSRFLPTNTSQIGRFRLSKTFSSAQRPHAKEKLPERGGGSRGPAWGLIWAAMFWCVWKAVGIRQGDSRPRERRNGPNRSQCQCVAKLSLCECVHASLRFYTGQQRF